MASSLTDTSRILLLSQNNPKPPPPEPSPPPQWRLTPAARYAVGIVALAGLAAVALGRPDLVALAAPFAIGTVAALAARPRRVPTATLSRVGTGGITENSEFTARVDIHNPDPHDCVAVTRIRASSRVGLRYGLGQYVNLVPGHADTVVHLSGRPLRWGPNSLGPARVVAVGCDGLMRTDPILTGTVPLRTYPSIEEFDSDQQLPDAAGMVGIHRSRRPGDGGELAEVRPYRAGDRLRRIDWRVSLRRQRELYVTSTLSERDADIVIVLDVLHDAGRDDGSGSDRGICDITVSAAAAITRHYTHQGDRVGLMEFGGGHRRLRPGTGRRHFQRTLEWLTDVRVQPTQADSRRLLTGGSIPGNATVIMLTPLIDSVSTDALAGLVRSGRRLITVDTLPPGITAPYRSQWTSAASRLWLLERDNTVRRLNRLGVLTGPWQGARSLDLMLAQAVRMGRAAKVVNR